MKKIQKPARQIPQRVFMDSSRAGQGEFTPNLGGIQVKKNEYTLGSQRLRKALVRNREVSNCLTRRAHAVCIVLLGRRPRRQQFFRAADDAVDQSWRRRA